MLESYSKIWNSSLGRYIEEPRHDDASHFGDSWRHLAIYKMLMMRMGNRQDRQSMENMIKNPNKIKVPWGRGFT